MEDLDILHHEIKKVIKENQDLKESNKDLQDKYTALKARYTHMKKYYINKNQRKTWKIFN